MLQCEVLYILSCARGKSYAGIESLKFDKNKEIDATKKKRLLFGLLNSRICGGIYQITLSSSISFFLRISGLPSGLLYPPPPGVSI